MKDYWRLIWAVLIAGIFSIVILENWLYISPHAYARSHAIIRTHATIRQTACAIQCMLLDGYENPISYDLLITHEYVVNNNGMALHPGDVILDAWKMPIILTIQAPNQYIFTSFGPNRQDDHGMRDDITEKIDMKGTWPIEPLSKL